MTAYLNKNYDDGIDGKQYDCVFTFNYSPVISNKKRNIPYIALVYDSPQVLLYSYTIINPCNYVLYLTRHSIQELKKEGINTVYYMPPPVNTDRNEKNA